jgi:hypothetical protein
MFRGDHPDLDRVLGRAVTLARGLGHPRVGSEHLLLSLTTASSGVATVLAERGVTRVAVQEAVCRAAPAGAGRPPIGTPWPHSGSISTAYFTPLGLRPWIGHRYGSRCCRSARRWRSDGAPG